jgi:hypothetical protein
MAATARDAASIAALDRLAARFEALAAARGASPADAAP